MSYGVKYRLQHKTSTNGTEATHVVELLKDGYIGSVTNIKGNKSEGVGKLFFEKINPKEPFEKPAIKGRFELYLQIRSQGVDSVLGYDGKAILDEIYASDENDFQMNYKINGSLIWTGAVLPGMMDYPDGQYVYSATIIAKDLTRLSGVSYGLNSGREAIITTIADILGQLGYNLPIYSYTAWTESGILATDDFLNQIYNDVFALRKYAQSGDETDQPIKSDVALNHILRNHGLILRQDAGVWRLYQLSALQNPAAVKEYQYNSLGVQQASATVDLTTTIDKINRFKKPGGLNSVNDGIKEARVLFDHRTTVSNIKFPDLVTIDGAGSPKEFTQYFQSDGNQDIQLSFRINALLNSPTDPVYGYFKIKVGNYSWNVNTDAWDPSQTINKVELQGTLNTPAGETLYIGFVFINTLPIPVDADGDITISFYPSDDSAGVYASETSFGGGSSYRINNTSVADGNNTAIEYELTQTANQSKNYDHEKVLFGDGPTSYSHAALTSDSLGANLTSDSWKLVGETSIIGHANLLLREFMDSQRSSRLSLGADLIGDYRSQNLIVRDSKNLFFLGGELTLGEHEWNGLFWEINIVTGTDDFNIIYKNSDSGTSSTIGSSGSGVSGTGYTDSDTRYLQQANNLSDLNDFVTARANLGVYSTSEADGLYGSLSGNNTWAGVNTFNADITINGNITQNGPAYINYAEQIKTTKDFIIQREGATGSIAAGAIAGSKILKADGVNDVVFGTDNSAVARVGWAGGTLQAIMTRPDSLPNGAITYWDNANSRVAGTANATVDGSGNVTANTLSITSTVESWIGGIRFIQAAGTNYIQSETANGSVISAPLKLTGASATPVNVSTVYNTLDDGSGAASFRGALSAGTLRPDSGKFLSPVSYQFRNAGDTGYRNAQMAGLTATIGSFSGLLTAAGNVAFAQTVEDKISLYGNSLGGVSMYGFGVEPSTLYYKSNGVHRWYSKHNADGGTSAIMELSGSGKLDAADGINIAGNPFVDSSRNVTANDVTFAGNVETATFSDWFSANPAGAQITQSGIGDFRTLYIDELIAKAFTVDVAQALAGSDILTKSVGILDSNFTIPAVGSSGTMTIEDLAGLANFQTFASGDWIRIRIVDRTNGLKIGDIWGTVTLYVDNAGGTQDWTFTTDYAGPTGLLVGEDANKGAVVLDYGTSGDSFIERTVLDRSSTSDFSKTPYSRMVRWTNTGTGGPRPAAATYQVLTQTGNLNGLAGYSSSTYGFYATDTVFVGDPSRSNNYLEFTGSTLTLKGQMIITSGSGYGNLTDKPTSLGVINSTEGTKLGGIATGADVTGANTANDTSNVNGTAASNISAWSGYANAGLNGAGYVKKIIQGSSIVSGSLAIGLNLTATYFGYYNGASWKNYFKSDGSGYLAAGNFVWDTAGNATLTGTVTADTFTLTAGTDYFKSDQTFSFGGGILSGTSALVNLASFAADANTLSQTNTNGSLYIGNNLSTVAGEKTMKVGFWYPNTATNPLPIIRMQAASTAGGENYTQMYYNDSGDWGFRGSVDGNYLLQLGSTNVIAGSYFDVGAQWAGSATKASATFLNNWAEQVLQVGNPSNPVLKVDGFADTGRIAGSYFDVGAQWAGSATKASATFLNNWAEQVLQVGSPSSPVFKADGFAGTGIFAGASFDSDRVYNYSSTGGLELNWTDKKLKIFEDNGTTARITLDGNSSVPGFPTTAAIRESVSGTNQASTSNLIVVDYENISGSYEVEEVGGSSVSTYDYTLYFEGSTDGGTTWNGINTKDGSLAGSSIEITKFFSISDKTGFNRFRLRVADRNSSGGNWQLNAYNMQQIKSEFYASPRGVALLGNTYMDIPTTDDLTLDITEIPSGMLFSDEKDSNNNWTVKVKA